MINIDFLLFSIDYSLFRPLEITRDGKIGLRMLKHMPQTVTEQIWQRNKQQIQIIFFYQ